MSSSHRWVSRIAFYTGAIGLLWVLGEITPSESELRARALDRLGVAQIYIAAPAPPEGG